MKTCFPTVSGMRLISHGNIESGTMGQKRKSEHSPQGENATIATGNLENDDHVSKKPRKETASAKRSLFVRSLPAAATTEALTELFSQHYPLKHATAVIDTATKQCKGYGFVTFADAEDAQQALDQFNGQIFQGRRIRIEIAQPRSRDMGESNGVSGKKSTISVEAAALKKARQDKLVEDRKSPKLIIRNLPWSVKTTEELADIFRGFGKVKHSTLPKVKNTQAGFGFVVMRGKKNAEKALAAINGKVIDGRTVAVDWAVEKDIWEEQNSSKNAEGDTESVESDAVENDSPNADDDVANFMRNFGDGLESEDVSDDGLAQDHDNDSAIEGEDGTEVVGETSDEDLDSAHGQAKENIITDNSSTLFIRNLPFKALDDGLKEHFAQFGPVRYARVVMDSSTNRPRGTGFVCFFKVEDAESCVRNAPRLQPTSANATKVKHSVLEDTRADPTRAYTIDGRVLHVSRAVDKDQATKLAEQGTNLRDKRDKDKRRLYLLSEGTIAAGTPLYNKLAPSEVKMREDSAKQRKKLIQTNPTLHLSLTRLSIRNLPRNIKGTDLKALAREAVVGFAKDAKEGRRAKLSKEEEARGSPEMKEAERRRKAKGKGVVKQSKIVFEGREGSKVSEDSGAGRSRGYGFIEYSSHRWALMGLRWLNGHALENASGKKQRLIVEFSIENAQVVQRRKEREEKARSRSKDVVEKRERGELPKKGNKAQGKPVKGNFLAKFAGKGKSNALESIANKKRKRGAEDGGVDGIANKKRKRSAKDEADRVPTTNAGEKQVKRSQIIQKKRMLRRNRKTGKA